MRFLTLFLCSVATLAHLPTQAQSAPAKQNWFDDPFFQVSRGLPGCPVPEVETVVLMLEVSVEVKPTRLHRGAYHL